MGCDIHMFLERKRATDTKWHADPYHHGSDAEYSDSPLELPSGRSYELFTYLAGVRGWGGPPPRGIPPDVSARVQEIIDYWGSDGHSHSYISINGYKTILKQLGYLHNFNINTYKYRNIHDEDKHFLKDDYRPFHIVLAYVHDEMRKNHGNYILTQDEYFLNEQFRIVFFFDN